MDRLKGKVAIVTGAAFGLGKAQAELFASEGARVILTDICEEAGATLAQAIQSSGAEAHFQVQDVTESDSWGELMRHAITLYGGLDILVNNAGIAIHNNLEQIELEEWRKVIDVNLDSVFRGTQEAIRHMKACGGGSIVNISSVMGIVADPELASYNASKGGVRMFTKAAALHCAKAGNNIRVNSVHPGYILTERLKKIFSSGPAGQELKAKLERLHPVHELGDPEDVAWGALYLASDESRFVTGSELVIDGGYSAQ